MLKKARLLTRPPNGTPRRAISPGEGLLLPFLHHHTVSPKGVAGLSFTARIGRAQFHRARSASKKDGPAAPFIFFGDRALREHRGLTGPSLPLLADFFSILLEHHVGSPSKDEGFISNCAKTRFDVLDVRGEIEPRRDLKIVEQLHAGSVAWSKQGPRNRTGLAAGTDVVPADAELIAPIPTKWTVTAETGTEKISHGSRISVAQ